jgi:acyl-CoA reductase-like NAD-dependent aldehyde dehydrogenase
MTSTDKLNNQPLLQLSRDAQLQWRRQNLAERLGFLASLRDHIIANRDSLVQFIHEVTGKPRYEILAAEIFPALSLIDQLLRLSSSKSRLGAARTLWLRTKEPGYDRQPVGLVLVVASVHAPFLTLLKIILPALVAGNAVVVQCSPDLEPINHKLLTILDDAGFPAHLVLSMVGDIELTKELIGLGVDHVSFCASSKQARELAALCGSHLTSCQATIDSRGVALVLEGAPILRAVRSLITSAFTNHGLAPGAVRIIYVAEALASQFESLLLAECAGIRQGLDSDFKSEIGPLPNLSMLQEITRLVTNVRGDGLELLAGGLGQGYAQATGPCFFQPTILRSGDEALPEKILEIPGPLIILKSFSKQQDVLKELNTHKNAALVSVWGLPLRLTRQIASQLIHRRVALNDTGSIVLSGQKHLGFDLHIDPLRIPLSLARSRPVHIKAWNQPVSPFCFPYDREKYRVLSDLMGKLFSSNPLHRGQAFFGAIAILASWSLED